MEAEENKDEIVQMSKTDLMDAIKSCVADHDICPLGMSKRSVDASKKLVEIIPALESIAENAPDINAAANLYAEGKKTISTTVKVILIAGFVTIFLAGIWAKITDFFGK